MGSNEICVICKPDINVSKYSNNMGDKVPIMHEILEY